MRFQLKEYAQRGLTDAMLTSDDTTTSSMLASLKMVLLLSETRHANMVHKVHQVHSEVRQMRQVLIESFQALTAATLAAGSMASSSDTQSQASDIVIEPGFDTDGDEDRRSSYPRALLSEMSTVGMKDPQSAESSVKGESPVAAKPVPRIKRSIVPKFSSNATAGKPFGSPASLEPSRENQMEWPSLLTMGETEKAGAHADLVFLKTPTNSHKDKDKLSSKHSRSSRGKAHRHSHHHNHHHRDSQRKHDKEKESKPGRDHGSAAADPPPEASVSIDLSSSLLKMCQPPITWYVHPSSNED
mmetsp:Transcript_6226/g.12603  ORF Transcript_6226/g.12603 Transcript_6226/m.12603 type:complete len:300 (+) Transcript_6226:457-1356(+)